MRTLGCEVLDMNVDGAGSPLTNFVAITGEKETNNKGSENFRR
jgi:hypothetical protein